MWLIVLSGTLQGLLAVPSFCTLQTLRRHISRHGNPDTLAQKHLMQLDWVSREDGSHILTVGVGSKILIFTPVSSDMAQANLTAMKESRSQARPVLLKQASSLAMNVLALDEVRSETRLFSLLCLYLKTVHWLPVVITTECSEIFCEILKTFLQLVFGCKYTSKKFFSACSLERSVLAINPDAPESFFFFPNGLFLFKLYQ